MKIKLVYVCSPLRGHGEKNIIRENIYSRFVYEEGCLPISPFVMLSQFIDEDDTTERKSSKILSLKLLEKCDELWAFGLFHTESMKREIEKAKSLKIKIRQFTSDIISRDQ
ncbi:MAG: DUF4406 domain-containing protein [Clostridia bacterium]|nr:DUF4406 domain-containing protein [Clostridia bacterium]